MKSAVPAWIACAAALVCSICAAVLGAQDQPAPTLPPPLEYHGKPVTAPFQCTADDLQWAGLSCTDDDPCPMYLELTTVESVGARIFVAGNIHSSAVTMYSILLGSDDGGATWREPHPRVRGAGLDHIQFADAETGWASGATLVPLPQDPFLLLTSDGGKTWRQRAVYGDSRDSRYGLIQQFFFMDKVNGSLIVDRGSGADGDRYELYESPDSGESWTIKETSSKPLRLKRTAAPQPDWRLHADAATESFRVERRQDNRWTTMGAFAVKLGVCKAPQVTPPAEPEGEAAADGVSKEPPKEAPKETPKRGPPALPRKK